MITRPVSDGCNFIRVYRGGRVEIIPNNQGNRITASWVGFYGEERLYVSRLFLSDRDFSSTAFRIGDSAKESFHSNPRNTVFDAKRLIGRTIEEIKRDLKHLPFMVKEKNGAPMISVSYEGEIREFVCSICQLLSFRPCNVSSQ